MTGVKLAVGPGLLCELPYLFSEKHRYGPIWNPEHLWVLVSGRLGMPRDFDYFTAQLEGRFGARVKVRQLHLLWLKFVFLCLSDPLFH